MIQLFSSLRASRAFLGLALVGFIITVSGGCVRSTVVDETVIFTNEFWVPLLVFFGGIAGGVAGWFLQGFSQRYAWILMIAGVIAVLFFAPALWLDRATVNPDSFSFRTGIYGTNQAEASFEEVRSVRVTTETGRRGRKTEYINFDLKNGETITRSLGNNVAREAAVEIILECQSRGIPCAM